MLADHEDLVRYIMSNYSNAGKIVEVGIGAERAVYDELKERLRDCEIIATDTARGGGIHHDDILDPDMEIYKGADLIYSIRPNPELVPSLLKLAAENRADLLIRPLSTDSCHKPPSMTLVNHGKAVMWILKT